MLPRWVVGHDVVIEVPEDVGRRLGSVWDDASQVDGGPSVDVNVWRPVNPHVGNWQEKSVNNVLQLFVLTNNVESDGIWLRWLGGNLTLVDPSVSLLHVFDQENPLVLGVVLRREPLVGCEGLLPGCQDVDIAMSHPGHLGGVFVILASRASSLNILPSVLVLNFSQGRSEMLFFQELRKHFVVGEDQSEWGMV